MPTKQKEYKRILLKLSGEELMGTEGFGIDHKVLDRMALEIGQLVGIGVQVRNSSVAFQISLEIARVTIHYRSNLVSTLQLLVWYVVTGITSGDYSEVIRFISSRVKHVSNVAAHTSIACTINLTPQTMLLYLSRTEQ